MTIGVCARGSDARDQLIGWILQYCDLYGALPEVFGYEQAEVFFQAMSLRRYDMAFVGLGGVEGFLAARRMREMDKDLKLVFIDDTDEYALAGMRLHFADYIVRPVTFKSVIRAMQLSGVVGGGP